MQHYWSLDDVHLHGSWLTIGSFDGVHKGHQQILREMIARAHLANSPAVVLTFHPHPAVVLGKRNDPFYLTSPEERASLLAELGVDFVLTCPFNRQVANTSAHDFMKELNEHLDISKLWVGYDFALGKDREGNVPRLRQLGDTFGYELHTVNPIKVNGEIVSSSHIRAALARGDVAKACQLLGRPYQVSGEVIHGDGRGRSLGIPTANLEVWSERAIPKAGVYVCKANVDGSYLGAVTNIGVRPTFENQPASPQVEAHLLDFDADLYGKKVGLEFIERLRDEQRFTNIQALVDQIKEDIERGREILVIN